MKTFFAVIGFVTVAVFIVFCIILLVDWFVKRSYKPSGWGNGE